MSEIGVHAMRHDPDGDHSETVQETRYEQAVTTAGRPVLLSSVGPTV